jgi:hypothetical protein
MDERWGYYLVGRMGRLGCPYSQFSVRITITKLPSKSDPVGNYSQHSANSEKPRVSEENVLLAASIKQILPDPEIAYTLRLGEIRLKEPDVKINILVKLEIFENLGQPHAGLVSV